MSWFRGFFGLIISASFMLFSRSYSYFLLLFICSCIARVCVMDLSTGALDVLLDTPLLCIRMHWSGPSVDVLNSSIPLF